jgi:hypothetical protein
MNMDRKEFGGISPEDDPVGESVEAPRREAMPMAARMEAHKRWVERESQPVDPAVVEAMPIILKMDPKFFIREQLNLQGVDQTLQVLFTDPAELELARFQFRGWLTQIIHVLRKWPKDTAEEDFAFHVENSQDLLRQAVARVKKLLRGEIEKSGQVFLKDDGVFHHIKIPIIIEIPPDHELRWSTYEGVAKDISITLGFLNTSERHKVSLRIASAGADPDVRAAAFKREAERYLREFNAAFEDKTVPIPPYFAKEGPGWLILQNKRDSIFS